MVMILRMRSRFFGNRNLDPTWSIKTGFILMCIIEHTCKHTHTHTPNRSSMENRFSITSHVGTICCIGICACLCPIGHLALTILWLNRTTHQSTLPVSFQIRLDQRTTLSIPSFLFESKFDRLTSECVCVARHVLPRACVHRWFTCIWTSLCVHWEINSIKMVEERHRPVLFCSFFFSLVWKSIVNITKRIRFGFDW